MPAFAQNGHKDYDIPLTAAEREAKEQSLHRMSSSDSHPTSLASVTSAEASSMNSSRESRKDDGDYDIPRPSGDMPPPPPPPPPLKSVEAVPTTKELVDKLFEGIGDIPEVDTNLGTADLEGMQLDLQSMHSNLMKTHSSLSSLSGHDSVSSSTDNLGVWDDVKFDENLSDTSSDSNTSGVVMSTPITDDDDALLDTWLKELEEGSERMSRLLSPDHSAPPTSTQTESKASTCT